VVPIPGTRSAERVAENAAAARVALSAEDLARIGDTLPRGFAAGTRYPEASMAQLDG
jgi:aryl-alcohol dehydrogenase-like predicted oxidoreductase